MTQLRQRNPQADGRPGYSLVPPQAPKDRRRALTPDEWRDRCIEVRALVYCGLTTAEIATYYGVSEVTLWRWGSMHPPFLDAMKELSEAADQRVVNALRQQALDGNVSAAIFWLKNRHPNDWRDKRDIDIGGELKTDTTDARQLALALIATMREAAEQGMAHPMIEGELSDETGEPAFDGGPEEGDRQPDRAEGGRGPGDGSADELGDIFS